MEKKSSSLSELRDAGAARKIMSAQAVTVQALEEVRRTTQVLRASIDQSRSRGFFFRRYFPVESATLRLPRAAPFSS
jgi:hypothetical protein